MERAEAFKLADGVVVAMLREREQALRPMLAELFERLDTPAEWLTLRGGSQTPVVYLLYETVLMVVRVDPDALEATVDRLQLEDTTITVRYHEPTPKPGGVWWAVTWEFSCGNVLEELTGLEGPPHAADDSVEFARTVAKAAGWPIAEPSG